MSLSTKLALLVLTLVLVSAGSSAWLIFWRLDQQLVSAKQATLEQETRLQSARLVDAVDELIRDVRVLEGTPPILGIVRARQHGGIDPSDGSTMALWRHRLGTIFLRVLRGKPTYLHVRYLGPDGEELVRVERGEDGEPRLVEQAGLQDKGERDYFRQAIERPRGDVYLSRIELNREHGVIEEPWRPVIRAATPAHGAGERAHGVVVINLAIGDRLKDIAQVADVSHAYRVVDELGRYVYHPRPGVAFAWELDASATRATAEFPLLDELSTRQSVVTRVDRSEGRVVSGRSLALGAGTGSARQLRVLVTDDLTDVTATSSTVLGQAALLIGVLATLAVAVGLAFARGLSRPIVELAHVVREVTPGEARPPLPTGLTGEAGTLADALEDAFEAAERHAQRLEAKNHELEQFAYIASHDLQEPLRTVTSYVDLLEEDLSQDLDEDSRQALRFITESVARMRMLVNGLLEYGRLGKAASLVEVDLGAVVDDVRQDLAQAITESGAELSVQGTLPTLRGYATELRLLLQNLIGNAIKYRHPGRPPHVEVSASASAAGWRISIADNGIGIPAKHRERVFLIFQRLHGRGEFEGTGIGLAHCRKVVDLHGGRLWIEDGINGGSRFVFTLGEPETFEEAA